MRLVVTTTQSKSGLNTDLEEFLIETELAFVDRAGKSISRIQKEYGADGVIVWNREGPILHIEEQKFYFHPSMAKNRISVYRKLGTEDPFVIACDLQNNDEILDCTLGLGADATVASFFCPEGRVIGLESSAPIAWVVKWGMKLYKSGINWLDEAIHRIEVINSNHISYLQSLPDNSFDIVYFDPMFRKPLLKSLPLSPLRTLANHEPLTSESIKEACRVARKRVVVKELADSEEFFRLGITKFSSSPNNKITYGIINV